MPSALHLHGLDLSPKCDHWVNADRFSRSEVTAGATYNEANQRDNAGFDRMNGHEDWRSNSKDV